MSLNQLQEKNEHAVPNSENSIEESLNRKLLDQIESTSSPKDLSELYEIFFKLNSLQISKETHSEDIKIKIQNRKIDFIKQASGIVFSFLLLIFGGLTFWNGDKNFGIFLSSIGLTTMGFSTNILKSFGESTNKKD